MISYREKAGPYILKTNKFQRHRIAFTKVFAKLGSRYTSPHSKTVKEQSIYENPYRWYMLTGCLPVLYSSFPSPIRLFNIYLSCHRIFA